MAIRVLPSDFTADPDRLARYEPEARLLASLNHADRATLYRFERSGGQRRSGETSCDSGSDRFHTNDSLPSCVCKDMSELLAPAVTESIGVDLQSKIGDLFDLHQARLHRLALRMTRNSEDARDLVQETFLRAARRAASVPPEPERAEAWLVRVLINLCRDYSRRQRIRRPAPRAGERPEARKDPYPSLLATTAVRSALTSLPARQRGVIVLHDLEDRPAAEIARLLGISAVTVRWHLARARRLLRRALGPGRGGEP